MITGFQASNIGQYGIEDFSFTGISRPYSASSYSVSETPWAAPGANTSSPFFGIPILDALGQIAAAWFDPVPNIQAARIPGVPVPLPGSEAGVLVGESAGHAPVVQEQSPYLEGGQVINPDYAPAETVFEEEAYFEPWNEWYRGTGDTDWGRVYDQYVVLNQPEEESVLFDWITDSVSTIGELGQDVGWWGGNQVTSPVMPPGSQYGPPLPTKVTVDTRTGKITKCKRRRRRKLLTESDFNVLLRVATLPNKENVRIVLGKAIGRS